MHSVCTSSIRLFLPVDGPGLYREPDCMLVHMVNKEKRTMSMPFSVFWTSSAVAT